MISNKPLKKEVLISRSVRYFCLLQKLNTYCFIINTRYYFTASINIILETVVNRNYSKLYRIMINHCK